MQPLNAKENLGLHWDLVFAIPAGTADKGAEFDVDQKYYWYRLLIQYMQ